MNLIPDDNLSSLERKEEFKSMQELDFNECNMHYFSFYALCIVTHEESDSRHS